MPSVNTCSTEAARLPLGVTAAWALNEIYMSWNFRRSLFQQAAIQHVQPNGAVRAGAVQQHLTLDGVAVIVSRSGQYSAAPSGRSSTDQQQQRQVGQFSGIPEAVRRIGKYFSLQYRLGSELTTEFPSVMTIWLKL